MLLHTLGGYPSAYPASALPVLLRGVREVTT